MNEEYMNEISDGKNLDDISNWWVTLGFSEVFTWFMSPTFWEMSVIGRKFKFSRKHLTIFYN